MDYSLITSDYIDVNGNSVLWSDNVRFSKYYDASEESWDRAGGGTSSWYLESTLPNDIFLDSVNEEKWGITSTVSDYDVAVDNKLSMSINNSSGSLYITSNGLWSLSGDFSIRLGIDLSDYYNEFRSSSSFGLNVSISDTYSVRIAIYKGYGYSNYYCKAFYSEASDPRYFGWFSLSSNISVDGLRFFSIKRVGNTITCYINGDIEVGSISGDAWLEDVYVSIGAECSEANKFSMSAKYFSIESGALAEDKTFLSPFRGLDRDFPEKSLFVVDDYGLSIIDMANTSLWMRFQLGNTKMFTDNDCKVSILNGRAHITSSEGLFILDFVDDVLYKYIGSSLYPSDCGISLRNADITFGIPQDVPMLMGDQVYDVFVKNISDKEVVAVATSSGINLIIDRIFTLYNNEGNLPTSLPYISSENNLYWSNYSRYTGGELSYYSNIVNLLALSGTSFSRSGFYSKTTSPYFLSSVNLNCIDVFHESESVYKIAIGNDSGLDVLFFPPENYVYSSSYSVVSEDNPLTDPLFLEYLGSSWLLEDSMGYPVALVERSSAWDTGDNTYSLKLTPGNGNSHPIYSGGYSGVYQNVDLSDVSRLFFDVRRVGPTSSLASKIFRFEVLVGSDVVLYYDEYENNSDDEIFGVSIDVSSYSGVHKFSVRAKNYYSSYSGNFTSYDSCIYIANFRSIGYNSDYEILGGTFPGVIGVDIIKDSSDDKVLYFTEDGYGSIDMVINSFDFFVYGRDIPPGVSFNQVDIVNTNESS